MKSATSATTFAETAASLAASTTSASSNMAAPLLPDQAVRSDDVEAAIPRFFLVTVEQLTPLRGFALEMCESETVGTLRTRFAAAVLGSAAQGHPTGVHLQQATPPVVFIRPDAAEPPPWRLIYDGAELAEDGATLRSVGIEASCRVVALERRTRRGLTEFVRRWWPLLLGGVIVVALLASALGADGECDRPLRAFVGVGAPILLPYALALCGWAAHPAAAEVASRRSVPLWFWRSRWLLRLVGANALLSFIWLILGGVWVFSESSSCALSAPQLHDAAIVAWAFLLLTNLPWALVLCLPCFALCKCPFAFAIIAHLGGVNRYPENGYL